MFEKQRDGGEGRGVVKILLTSRIAWIVSRKGMILSGRFFGFWLLFGSGDCVVFCVHICEFAMFTIVKFNNSQL